MEGLGEAAQAQADGDAEAAERGARAALSARPRGVAGARAHLALGLALRGRGRFAEAATSLLAAEGELDSTLAAVARFHLADAWFYAGHAGAAAQLFASAAQAGGPLSERARWREADALLGAGLGAQAAQAYQHLLLSSPGHPAAPGARLSLAAARRDLGDEAGAVALYRQVWLEQPADAEGRAAGQALRAWRASGGPVPEATPEERLERAERLLLLARPRRALRALDRLDAGGPAHPRSALLRALALLQVGRPAEAEALAGPLRQRPGTDRELSKAAELVLARAAARQGRADEASTWYRKVAAARPLVPGMSPQQLRDLPEDAAYLSAWLHYEAGRYARAAVLLDRYARAHPRSKRALDARWFRAWSFYRLGRRAEARLAFAALEKGPLAAGALYWQARLVREPRRRAALYRAAFQAPEAGWYALLAEARLRALGEEPPPFPAPVAGRPLPEVALEPGPAASLHRALALFGVGLREEALAELRALADGPRARGRAAALAELAAFAGDPEIPFRMARDHLMPTARVLRWSHPEAYPGVLRPAASGFGVDPWLLLSVMRRESGFRAEARSGAAAEGLLQLIPPTAERLATVLGLPRSQARRLGEPEVSISFGAYYLGLLSARFGDGPELLAAYNAGPAAAAAWARGRAGLPLDEWVEEIGYRETRQYVRLVMADGALYRRLYGAPPLALDPDRKVAPPRGGIGF
jgi:soluble lytic murein transglycosylase